jgi:hypothetical protein
MTWDTGDLGKLAADLTKAAAVNAAKAETVVRIGAQHIKNDWRDRWKGLAHAPALPYAITYDVQRGIDGGFAGEIKAEIGPDKNKAQGPLGNIIEFGTSKNGPLPGGQPALDAEEPRFVRALTELAGDVL